MFLLGSFTQGLFGGAQSTMSLYQGFQNIQAMQDASDQSKAMRDQRILDAANQNVPGWYPGATQPAAIPGAVTTPGTRNFPHTPGGMQVGGDAESPAPQVPGANQPLSAPQPAAPVPNKPTQMAAIPGFNPAQTDLAIRTQQAMAGSPGVGSGVGPSEPPDNRLAPRIPMPPTSATGGVDDYGRPLPQLNPAKPGTSGPGFGPPSAVAQPPAAPGAQAPMQAPVQGSLTSPTIPPTGPRSSGPMIYPPLYPTQPQSQAEQQTGMQTLSPDRPYPPANTGAPPAPQPQPLPPSLPPAPSPTARAQTGLGTIFPGANPPPGSQPLSPQQIYGGTPPGYTPPAPPPGGTPRGGQPQASIGGSILGALGIGTAEAATPGTEARQPGGPAGGAANTPEQQAAIAQAQAKDSGTPVRMADGRVAHPDGSITTVPAEQAARASPTHVEAGPVSVPTKVTPPSTTQAKPAVASETPPTTPVAPVVSPRFSDIWRSKDQAGYELMLQRIKANNAEGIVFPDQVAAHAYRESGGTFSPNTKRGHDGEYGLLQVLPSTWASMEKLSPSGRLDPTTLSGQLDAGILYMRYLAMDKHLGPNTVQTNFAYMRGPGGADFVAKYGVDAASKLELYRLPLVWTANMYEGKVQMANGHFTGSADSPNHVAVTVPGAMAAAQQGPDGTLHYIATTGSAGLPMSMRWAQYQSALERAAIWSGHMDMLPHIADFVLQQSHMGALSNLAAADAALSAGNVDAAGQYLAKAHAFFPDGTMGEFGKDDKGVLWGRQISEGTGQAMGAPIRITPEMLRMQMMALGNPATYAQVLQEYRLKNAQIDRDKAYGEYLRARPAMAEERQADIEARQADRQRFQEEQQARNFEHQNEMKGVRAENTSAIDKEVTEQFANKPEGMSSDRWAAQAEIYRALRMPEAAGGFSMGAPSAMATAEGVITGRLNLDRVKSKLDPTKEEYHITEKNGQVRATLGTHLGEKLELLPGLGTRSPLDTSKAPGHDQHSAISPIGAGAGSQMAALQGYNQNLAGVPMRPMQQPQQQAIG